MTKIFITIPWFLPAFRAGGPIQSIANLVKEFDENVAYYIFCGDTDLNGAALENIITGEWVDFNEHTKIWYAAPGKASDSLVKQVEFIKPDLLYIVGIYSWHYNIVPLLYCNAPLKILSTRGMLHPGALSQKKWKKKIYLRLFRLFEYHHKVHFHATDEEEHKYISNFFGKAITIHTAGNYPNKIAALPVAEKTRGHLKLLSIALISPMKNILLVLEALSKLEYNIQYDIYGPVKDHDYWMLCKEQMKALPKNISATWHGELQPGEVIDAIEASHVFILPSKSENFGHAFYEALSAGRPVITSHNTPWQHLPASKAGMNVSLGGVTELADAIGFFAAMDMEELSLWSLSAHNYASEKINIDDIRKQYDRMFQITGLYQKLQATT